MAAFAKRQPRFLTVAAILLVLGFYGLVTDGAVALPFIGFAVFIVAAVVFDRVVGRLHTTIDEAYPPDPDDA